MSSDRRSLSGDALVIAAGLVLTLLTWREYRFSGDLSGSLAQPGASLAVEARIQSAKSYLTSHPDDFSAWADLAVACYQKGPDAYVEGLNALDKARKLGATGESLFWYAGVMFQGVGLADYAINELEKYQHHHPRDRQTRARLANLYVQKKRYDDAWRLYVDLRSETPNDPVVLFNVAFIAKERGDWKLAEDTLGALHRVAPQAFLTESAALEKEIARRGGGTNGQKS